VMEVKLNSSADCRTLAPGIFWWVFVLGGVVLLGGGGFGGSKNVKADEGPRKRISERGAGKASLADTIERSGRGRRQFNLFAKSDWD